MFLSVIAVKHPKLLSEYREPTNLEHWPVTLHIILETLIKVDTVISLHSDVALKLFFFKKLIQF